MAVPSRTVTLVTVGSTSSTETLLPGSSSTVTTSPSPAGTDCSKAISRFKPVTSVESSGSASLNWCRAQIPSASPLKTSKYLMDRGYARAHALLSWALWWAAYCYWLPDRPTGYRESAAEAEYAVSLDPGGRVHRVDILQYRESYGGEVRGASWLAQFVGKTSASPLAVGNDIRNISGATLSCHHVTEGVKRVLATYGAKGR